MRMRSMLLAAAAALTLSSASVMAETGPGPNDDPEGYYSQSDHEGYYDRNGHYQHFNDGNDDHGGPPPPPGYYHQGSYEESCHRGNRAAGTIFGGLGGGLIGGAASHGNGGAILGGIILGGLLGNAISGDMDCEDHGHAFRVYSDGLNGDLGERHEWRNDGNGDYGYFTPTRDFRRDGFSCREFTTVTYRHGESSSRTGTACRTSDGEWHID